jgi:hypothetical protein
MILEMVTTGSRYKLSRLYPSILEGTQTPEFENPLLTTTAIGRKFTSCVYRTIHTHHALSYEQVLVL